MDGDVLVNGGSKYVKALRINLRNTLKSDQLSLKEGYLLARPEMGKEFFELTSLVVSAVNGCESCVTSHEASLRKLDTSEERIFDAVRLDSVVSGMTRLIY